jgi:lysozyme family protein
MAKFELAVPYVLESEGRFSNDKADRGGETWYGISRFARDEHRRTCVTHRAYTAERLLDELRGRGGRELALHIYRHDFWRFDGVRDQRVATKLFDIVVNIGAGVRVIQRAAGVAVDGRYGPQTEAALNAIEPDDLLERLSLALGDHYVRLAVGEFERELAKRGMSEEELAGLQVRFLVGWIRRAIKHPR